MSNLNNILDLEEIIPKLKFQGFTIVAQRIKRLTIINIGITIIIMLWSIIENGINKEEIIGYFIGATFAILSLCFPFLYLRGWLKMEQFSAKNNPNQFKIELNLFRILFLFSFFLALIWGMYSLFLFVFPADGRYDIDLTSLILIIITLFILANHLYQMWFFIKAFSILRKHKQAIN